MLTTFVISQQTTDDVRCSLQSDNVSLSSLSPFYFFFLSFITGSGRALNRRLAPGVSNAIPIDNMIHAGEKGQRTCYSEQKGEANVFSAAAAVVVVVVAVAVVDVVVVVVVVVVVGGTPLVQ